MFWFQKRKFGSLAQEILESKKILAPNTQVMAAVRLKRLIRFFGKIPLIELTEAKWENYVLERFKELPGCKLFDDRKYLQQVMLEAHQRKWIERVPRLRNPDLPTNTGREITEVEMKRLLEHAPETLRFQIEIAALMGLRLREMLYLRWDQVDFGRQTIRLLAADTKTRREREVPINSALISRFRRRFLERRSPYVFPRKNDPSRPRHDNKGQWKLCKKKAEINARWHDLRHSAATAMLRRGNSIQAVSLYLGMSTEILTKIYQHLNIDDLRAVERSMKSAQPSHG